MASRVNDGYLFVSNFLFRFLYLILTVCALNISVSTSEPAVNTKNKESPNDQTSYFRNSQNIFSKMQNNDHLRSVLESLQNNSVPFDISRAEKFFEQIYGKFANDELTRREQLSQITSWLTGEDSNKIINQSSYLRDLMLPSEDHMAADYATAEALRSERFKAQPAINSHQIPPNKPSESQSNPSQKSDADDDKDNSSFNNYENHEEESGPSGTTKSPPCAHYGRYYCSYKEDYPIKVVTEVTKYYKWPLEKLFRDLRQQVMPTLANDNAGGLVCDSITRIVRPGWSKNTNGRWLVVINTDHYQQYVTEVICRHGTGSYCNFIPPCYHSSCRQRYNTQKLLVIDPWVPYKGPFLSEFLFPSCCVCYIPAEHTEGSQSASQSKLTSSPTNHLSQASTSGTVPSVDKTSTKVS